MTLDYRIGDVRDRLAEIPDDSVDLIVTSPPFLALRAYLPDDHPDKVREIGAEPTPAEFLDTLLHLTIEWGRILAPHGTLCVELGDTYAGSGGAGGDYNAGGLRAGQGKFTGSSRRGAPSSHKYAGEWANPGFGDRFKGGNPGGRGWPLPKSLAGVPTLYTWSLAYGRNLLRAPMTARELLEVADRLLADGVDPDQVLADLDALVAEHDGPTLEFEPWRIRNLIVWARPNPPVGELGDKFRPATSYITVATRSPRRYFDLDAVRTEAARDYSRMNPARNGRGREFDRNGTIVDHERATIANPAGAPPLDWHADDHPADGDWLWKLSTRPYRGSHYATFPIELPRRLILAMCPWRVCAVCGEPSRRLVEHTRTMIGTVDPEWQTARSAVSGAGEFAQSAEVTREFLGWSDCGHGAWRPGVVLDPFAGSGTTIEAAMYVGRDAIGIDLDPRNADLARERVGMYLQVRPLPPRRVQLLRAKGWRKPENTTIVARPSRWGNPITADPADHDGDLAAARVHAVRLFRDMLANPTARSRFGYPSDDEIRAGLAGRDLACWCPPEHVCHADVLLEIANAPTPTAEPSLFDVADPDEPIEVAS